MISEITLAMTAGSGWGGLPRVIHPYPTQAEAIRKAGDAYNRTRLTPTVSACSPPGSAGRVEAVGVAVVIEMGSRSASGKNDPDHRPRC